VAVLTKKTVPVSFHNHYLNQQQHIKFFDLFQLRIISYESGSPGTNGGG
jgi:hypothetical protein